MIPPEAVPLRKRVAVVGAGAAGLTAALRAAESGASVVLLNAHPKIGLKILMSGGTRCNVTHREVTERDYHGGSRPFVARILRAFTPAETLEWFAKLGVALKLEETGKYFPESDDAQTVLSVLLDAVVRAGVDVRSGTRVVRLERSAEGEPSGRTAEDETTVPGDSSSRAGGSGTTWRLGIQHVRDSAAFAEVSAVGRDSWELPRLEPDEWLVADAVVLATGGLSFPRTGSDGTGYALAQSLGHTLEPTTPALTPLTATDSWCDTLQGLTCDAALTLWSGAARAVTVRGSLLFAHFGYSGPVALDLSRHWFRAKTPGRVTASFLPEMSRESLHEAWRASAAADPRRTVRRFLGEWLPDRLVVALARDVNVGPALALAQVPRVAREKLIAHTLEREMPVTGTLGYEKAEVTAGGVRLSEVNPSTLESRKAPGVFLCGEVLDVEGRLGGFNFQFSWSSGTVAGRAAAST